MTQEDDPRLSGVIQAISEGEGANVEPYDKAILTLSSAALALSLTFTKDVVPLLTASGIWLLYSSWVLFVLTLSVNIWGYIVALHGFRRQWKLSFRVFRHRTATEKTLQKLMEDHRETLYRLNVGQGCLFLAAMLALASFMMINIYLERTMQKPTQSQQHTSDISRAKPSAAYVPSQAPAQAPVEVPASGEGKMTQSK